MTVGINGAELIILIVLAVLILGPEKLPEYARKLTQWIRQMRQMAEGAKAQFKEETGTDFDEIDWRRYDPRQYDPRRIIKDALSEPVQEMRSTVQEAWDHEAVRQDLQAMDPRDLVRGRARSAGAAAAETRSGATGASGASGSGSTAMGAGALAAGPEASAAGGGQYTDAEGSSAAGADPADGVEGTEEPEEILPAPFDAEAT